MIVDIKGNIQGGYAMTKVKKYIRITFFLSGLSMLALVLSHLALTDISHGGEDLSFEWTILRISAIIFITFIIFTILTLRHVLKGK